MSFDINADSGSCDLISFMPMEAYVPCFLFSFSF